MKKNYLLFFFFLYQLSIHAQAPSLQWQDAFGGSDFDSFKAVVQTSDGGYIATGHTVSNNGEITSNHGEYDMLLVKYNATGTIQWKKTLGGSKSDEGYAIRQTSDNGYIISGCTNSTDGDAAVTHSGEGDYWIVKTDESGNIQWQKSYGGNNFDISYDVIQTSDGGYIVIGEAHSSDGDVLTGGYLGNNIWVLKLDVSGNIQWKRAYGGNNDDRGFTIVETPDGGFIFSSATNSCGQEVIGLHDPYNCTGSFTNTDFWIVKINQIGDILWKNCMGTNGTDGPTPSTNSMALTSDGGVIVCGFENPSWTGYYQGDDFKVYKLSSLGTIEWEKKYGGNYTDRARGVIQTSDGGYAITGYTNSNNGDVTGNHSDYVGPGYGSDIWLAKTNSSGTIQWKKCFGGNSSEESNSLQQTTDNGFIIAGSTWSNNNGNVGINNGSKDAWIIKLSPATLATETFEKRTFAIYPNPAQSEIFIDTEETISSYTIYDSLGRLIKTGSGGLRVNISDLNSGIYIYECITSNQTKTTLKFVKS